MPLTSLSLLSLTLFGLWRAIHRRRCQQAVSRAGGCQVARSQAPVRDPIIGLDFIYDVLFKPPEDRYLALSQQAHARLGPTYTVRRWAWEVIYTCDSRNIKHLLASGFSDFALPRLRVAALETLVGRGIFTLNGQAWSRARARLKPLLARLDHEAAVEALEGHFQAMLNLICPCRDSLTAQVDLQPLFFRLAMEFAGSFLLGASTGMLHKSEAAEGFVRDYMTCSTEVVRRLGCGPLQHLRFSPRCHKAKQRVFGYIERFIDDALATAAAPSRANKAPDSVLVRLAAVTPDRAALRDQVLHLLVASRDTTASMLSNLFFVLAQEPAVWTRLRHEVMAISGQTCPSVAQLRQMQYARWCVNESLRLHPVIPTNAREATRDTTIPRGGGPDGTAPLLVRRGIVVVYNLYAMHRDANVFGPNPEAFVPERWAALRPGWGFLPFNGGARTCLGQQLALTEALFVVARMAQTFERIHGLGGREWVELYALATTCRDGVEVKLQKG
ncbi:hypothetical protein CDD81_6959 [Ophiocordyceps australis]|uniref:Cytochrome P450 n=1 Tax=Ophiocordyceps australis TaxID=1399860 RepID=A0A2C5YHM0_9HYPO|nr:hypothetical protein CDD81_6959 [Ophiocordyceps australis]